MFVQAVLSGVLACGLVSSAALPSRLGSRHALSPFARRQVVAQIATYPAGKDCQGEAMDIMYVNPDTCAALDPNMYDVIMYCGAGATECLLWQSNDGSPGCADRAGDASKYAGECMQGITGLTVTTPVVW